MRLLATQVPLYALIIEHDTAVSKGNKPALSKLANRRIGTTTENISHLVKKNST